MASYISAELRRQVSERARFQCEYCLIHEEDTFYGCQVDHIISEKHGGATEFSNLALACALCNRAKGSDIGTLSKETDGLIRFYNPRKDQWPEHFRIEGSLIESISEIGNATATIFGFNLEERVEERTILIRFSRYPPKEPGHS